MVAELRFVLLDGAVDPVVARLTEQRLAGGAGIRTDVGQGTDHPDLQGEHAADGEFQDVVVQREGHVSVLLGPARREGEPRAVEREDVR